MLRALSRPALLALCLAASPVARAEAPSDLPARVSLKTRTESFTSRHYVVVRDGKLWIKANEETTGAKEAWRLLPPDGLPHGKGKKGFAAPQAIRELSADGDNLVAIATDGHLYYMKWSTMTWVDDWGLPPFRKQLFVTFDNLGLAMSHRGKDNLFYEDIDGNKHPVSAGVTTYYALSADGREISYADPWLPPDFSHYVCAPLRGRFTALSLSASASTLFVIDAAGRMFTRLADFDVTGENPVLPFSYERAFRKGGGTRTLPGEDWKEQPAIPGKITQRITILQTGQGNAARELRVEGVDSQGRGGYWKKAIQADSWEFVATGATVAGPFLHNAANPDSTFTADALLGPSLERAFVGTLRVGGIALPVQLIDYNPRCSPSTLRLGEAGHTLDLPLHLRGARLTRDGSSVEFRGALLAATTPAPDALAPALKRLFGKKKVLDLHVQVANDVLSLKLRGRDVQADFTLAK